MLHELDEIERLYRHEGEQRIAAAVQPREVRPAGRLPRTSSAASPAHTHGVSTKDGAGSREELKFFDAPKVPAQTIVLTPTGVEGLSSDQYEIISEKATYRLPQRPGGCELYRRSLGGQVRLVSTPIEY